MIKQNSAGHTTVQQALLLNHEEEMTQFLMALAFYFMDI